MCLFLSPKRGKLGFKEKIWRLNLLWVWEVAKPVCILGEIRLGLVSSASSLWVITPVPRIAAD